MSTENNQLKENGIYYRDWPVTEQKTKAVVLLVHGLGEHCERYSALANALNNAGYALASIDLPGHGQSTGTRGHIDRFKDYQAAVLERYQTVKQQYSGQDVFLLGHSMGGLISTHLLLEHQDLFKGALLSGAAIQSPQAPPSWQIKLIGFISKLFPTLGMLQLDASGVSRDPVEVEKYENDPLVNKGKLSARLIAEMFKAMAESNTRASEIKLPMLIMHGGADVMTAPEGSEFLYEQISSTDKQLKVYPELCHEIFNEPEKNEIYAEVVAWLNQHSK